MFLQKKNQHHKDLTSSYSHTFTMISIKILTTVRFTWKTKQNKKQAEIVMACDSLTRC